MQGAGDLKRRPRDCKPRHTVPGTYLRYVLLVMLPITATGHCYISCYFLGKGQKLCTEPFVGRVCWAVANTFYL